VINCYPVENTDARNPAIVVLVWKTVNSALNLVSFLERPVAILV
jgi:hypothetical protein